MLLQTYIQNKAFTASEEDQKSRREEENMLVPALAKKKRCYQPRQNSA
jgi:hypothetical protein